MCKVHKYRFNAFVVEHVSQMRYFYFPTSMSDA